MSQRDTVVLLSIWGAPASSAYLRKLSALANIRLVCVFEDNAKGRREIERIYRERFGEKAPKFEMPEEATNGGEVPYFLVPSANCDDGLARLRELEPSLIVLGGSGIVKPAVLSIPSLGTLNCHPGLLPRYRGCTCLEWAIYEDEPVGATCHFVTKEIDAGDILRKKMMPIHRGDSYVDIRLRMFEFQADLMADVLRDLMESSEETLSCVEKFDWSQAKYYKPIPDRELSEVMAKIQSGTYRHQQAERHLKVR